jgi:hypothetical protein
MRPVRLLALGLALPVAFAAAAAAGPAPEIVSEGRLERLWTPLPEASARPPYPLAATAARPQVCVSLGFLIGTDGHTSAPVELDSWRAGSSGRPARVQVEDFVQAAAAALAGWRFRPTGKARAVFTSATFAFDPEGAAAGAVADRCRIRDLPRHLQKVAGEQRKSNMHETEYQRGLSAVYGCTSFSSACVLER